jgi:folate-binding protein YgfZ
MPSVDRLPLHDVHAATGAVFAERRGHPVVASYGDARAEYTAALEGAGLVDLAERAVLVVSGPGRQAFLQGMLSNDVSGRSAGQGCRAALLDTKGHVLALVRVLVKDDAVLLETGSAQVELLRGTLERHRVAAPVRFEIAATAILAALGLRAGSVLHAVGIDPPLSAEDHRPATLAGQAIRVARAGDLPGGGFVLLVSPGGAAAVFEALRAGGAAPVGRDALDARRVEDRRPWYGGDVTADTLLHETGLVAELHSPQKGCYLGQETVARLEARGGHVNKALRRLRLSAPAAPDAPARAGGRDVGRLTTAALSPRFGPVAMAYVRRDHFAAGTVLEVEGAAATVVDGFDPECGS